MAENGDAWRVDDGESLEIAITLPGSRKAVSVARTTPFAAKMRELAKKCALKKFAIFVDGNKINKTTAPNDFTGLKTVEIKKYDSVSW